MLALGSVRLLKQELGEHGVASKVHVSAEGRRWGGHALTRGALYAILRNRLYIGEVVHRDKHYPGEHKAIIDQSLWDQTQALLTDHAVERKLGIGAAAPSCLVPECDGASLTRKGEDALWQSYYMAAPARRRVFEPSSKHRKRAPGPLPSSMA